MTGAPEIAYSQGVEFRPMEMKAMTETAPEAPATHPEEMRATFDLRVGEHINLHGSARLTPAGIVAAGLMTVAVLVARTALVRAVRR
jgi:hypothetical protein